VQEIACAFKKCNSSSAVQPNLQKCSFFGQPSSTFGTGVMPAQNTCQQHNIHKNRLNLINPAVKSVM